MSEAGLLAERVPKVRAGLSKAQATPRPLPAHLPPDLIEHFALHALLRNNLLRLVHTGPVTLELPRAVALGPLCNCH